jgi:hypothetical protein
MSSARRSWIHPPREEAAADERDGRGDATRPDRSRTTYGDWRILSRKGHDLINVSYASTRRSIDDHAASLARAIDNPMASINHFVCQAWGTYVVM